MSLVADSQGSLVEHDDVAADMPKAHEMLASVQMELENVRTTIHCSRLLLTCRQMNAYEAESKARRVLLGLGFSSESLEGPMSKLSGGWQTRCSLACALCQSPDILLLDEPTNFLDLPAIIWLEKYLKDLGGATTVVVTTHDRAFADGVAEELLILREQKISTFRGGLTAFETDRSKTFKYLSKMQDAQDKQKKHIQTTIEQSTKAAKRAGDDKRLKQVASRKKKLDERMGMEVSAKGGRFKLNRDLVGYHETMRGAIELPSFDPPARIVLPASPPDLRFPGALLSMENVTFGYPPQPRKNVTVRNATLTVHMGDRVGLVGLNGSGKSTLVSLAMGMLSPTEGQVTRHPRAGLGLYSQQAVRELENLARSSSVPTTALSHLMEVAAGGLSEQEARAALSSLGLSGKVASDVPLQLLSGGQKVRLALAKILWNAPHLLILDEVTTHLDADTIDALAKALRSYEAAVIIITHDRFFMQRVVEGKSVRDITGSDEAEDSDDSDDNSEDESPAKVGTVFRLTKGKLVKLEGGMQAYEAIAERSSSKIGKV
jgi:ATP-binding cassette, subfamily F, member 3